MPRFMHVNMARDVAGKPAELATHQPSMAYVTGDKNFQRRVLRRQSLLPPMSELQRLLFKLVEEGDLEEMIDFLEEHRNFDISCRDYVGNTPLVVAVKKEHDLVVEFLLQFHTGSIKDALLHAIQIGNAHLVDLILRHQSSREESTGYEEEDVESVEFTSEITPLILAAQCEHVEIIDMLLRHGHNIVKPHMPDCYCKERCSKRIRGESLGECIARLNTYKALCSPAYICQTSTDPILTSFELSDELRGCADIERELKSEYTNLREKVMAFAVALLDQTRTTDEVRLILQQKAGSKSHEERGKFARIALAAEYEQKEFIAHPNTQCILRMEWLATWQDWRSLSTVGKLIRLLPRMLLLPVMAIVYWFFPYWTFIQSWRSPINKFFSFVASYIFFLIFLIVQIELETKHIVRGPPETGLELPIVLYVLGMIWIDIKCVWQHGSKKYLAKSWNWYNTACNTMFALTFMCWGWAYYDVQTYGNKYLPRKFWNQYDPTLVSESFFAFATIMAFGKVMYFFQVGERLGPMQMSFGRMFRDITDFLTIFLLVMLSFAAGLHKLYHYYWGQVRTLNGIETRQTDNFISLQAALKTEFWSLFGYTPPIVADVVISEHTHTVGNRTLIVVNKHKFTEAVGHWLFGAYAVVSGIILINMLIAMMSTSFMIVQNNADTEWKFSRTVVWLQFFDDGNTLPPPFNLVPSPKTIWYRMWWMFNVLSRNRLARLSFWRCCFFEEEDDDGERLYEYQLLMSSMVQRYFSQYRKRRNEESVTTNEADQLRHELLELKNMVRTILQDAEQSKT